MNKVANFFQAMLLCVISCRRGDNQQVVFALLPLHLCAGKKTTCYSSIVLLLKAQEHCQDKRW